MSGTRRSDLIERLRGLCRFTIGLLLTLPFLVWIWRLPDWRFPQFDEWLDALMLSLEQAMLSTGATLCLGFLLFRALQNFKKPKLVEVALVFPNVLPPLFVAMSLLAWTPWIGGTFPFGLGAVVFAHVLLNGGLVAISLDRVVKSRLSGLTEAAHVMGVKPFQFWRRIAWPLLKGDVASLSLFIFSLHFTSFSLPLLLSDQRGVTLEVAIFDAIRMEGRWDKAVVLALTQVTVLFFLSLLLPRPFWPERPQRLSLPYLPLPKGFGVLALVPMIVLAVGWLMGWAQGVLYGLEPAIEAILLESVMTTVLIGLSAGFFHLLVFLMVAWSTPHAGLTRFLSGYLAPSSAITGFAFLLLPAWGEAWLRVSVALTLISFPLLYRWLVHSALAGLERQIVVARTLSAGWLTITSRVIWPQAGPLLLRASGLGALWASGDFAISGILLSDENTLPLVMDDLLNGYHLEEAQLLLMILVLTGGLVYSFFAGAARYVCR